MEQLTNCFGGGLTSCAKCKRFLPLQEDMVMRMYFVAPPKFIRVTDNEVACEGFINKEQQASAND